MFQSFRGVFSKDKWGMALALAVGLTLLYLAVPRAVAGFIMQPGNRVLNDIQEGGAIDEQALVALVESRRRAAGWIDSGRLWSDLAVAQFMLAETGVPSGGADFDRIRQASESLEIALALAPANPHAWTRRAYAELLLGGPSEAAASALVMAMLTARYEPDLLFVRLQLGLVLWPRFTVEDRELVLDQIRIAWRKSPERLVNIAADTGRIAIVRGAFAGAPETLAAVERQLGR